MVLLVVAIGVGYVNWRYGQIKRVDVRLSTPPRAGQPENFLIAGSDNRAGITRNSPDAGAFLNGTYDSGERSDSIMILRVDPKATRASLLSIPRDLWLPIAGKGYSAKINAAFAASPQTLISTIEQDFGIPINHYVDVDFVGFQRLVDAIGGVNVYFDVPMRDTHTGLDVEHPGCVKLNGQDALAFARSRYLQYYDPLRGQWVSDDASDFGRIKRQQFLIRHAIERVDQQGFVTSPVELDRMASAFVSTVSVDKKLGLGDLRSLAGRFRKFDANHLDTYSIPVDNYFVDGQDALQMRTVDAQPILNQFRGVTSAQLSEQAVTVKVYNGSGVTHQAANAGGALQAVGFRVIGTGDASAVGFAQPTHTEVVYSATTDQPAADLLARHLTSGATVVQNPAVPSGVVYLVTGPDFTTVQAQAKPANASTHPITAPSGSSAANAGTGGSGAAPAPNGGSAMAQAPASTTTTVVGRVPPDTAPPGQRCG